MGILQGLERRLQGAVDKTFARIFGGSVQPAEVTNALAQEAAARSTTQAGRTIAPNRYIVELGPSDAADVGEDLRRVSSAFSAMLARYIREQGWETYADVDVTLRESGRLHTGQFRVSSLVDPGVDPTPRSGPRPAPYAPAQPPSRARGRALAHAHQPGYGQLDPYHYPPGNQPNYPPGNQPDYPPPSPRLPDQYYAAPPGDYAQQREPRGHQPAPGPLLIVDDGTGRSYVLQRGSNVVGRGQSAALRLADTSVSREHLDVYFDGVVAVVHDLGSTNGTTVNGTAIQTWQLADGDVIRAGQTTVLYRAR